MAFSKSIRLLAYSILIIIFSLPLKGHFLQLILL